MMQSNEILDNCKSLKFRDPGSEFHGSYLVDWSPHSILINHSWCYLLCLKIPAPPQKKKKVPTQRNILWKQILRRKQEENKNTEPTPAEILYSKQRLKEAGIIKHCRYRKAEQDLIGTLLDNKWSYIRQQMELSKWKTHENAFQDWNPHQLPKHNIKGGEGGNI